MKEEEKTNLSEHIVDIEKTLQIVYHKGYVDGIKQALKIMKETRDEKKTNI